MPAYTEEQLCPQHTFLNLVKSRYFRSDFERYSEFLNLLQKDELSYVNLSGFLIHLSQWADLDVTGRSREATSQTLR